MCHNKTPNEKLKQKCCDTEQLKHYCYSAEYRATKQTAIQKVPQNHYSYNIRKQMYCMRAEKLLPPAHTQLYKLAIENA